MAWRNIAIFVGYFNGYGMKKIVILLAMVVSVLSVNAKNNKENNFEFTHNRFAFSGLLTSSDSYQLEAAYHYMFNQFVGIGGGIGYWSVYYEDGWAAGKDWEVESDDNKPSNFYLRPSVVLKSPAIKFKQVDLGLFAEPGLMLNIPYEAVNIRQTTRWPDYEYKHVSTTNGQWFALDLRLGVFLNVGSCGFCAGYMMSNLDVYSQYRHLSYKGISFKEFYPRKSFMQGAYLSASYYF